MHIRDDRPLDVTLIALLRAVEQCARQTGTRYCIVGATARDLLLKPFHPELSAARR